MLGIVLTVLVALATLGIAFSGISGEREKAQMNKAVIHTSKESQTPKR